MTLLSRAIRECEELKHKAESTLQHMPAHIAERYCAPCLQVQSRSCVPKETKLVPHFLRLAQVAMLRASRRDLGNEIHRHAPWLCRVVGSAQSDSDDGEDNARADKGSWSYVRLIVGTIRGFF